MSEKKIMVPNGYIRRTKISDDVYEDSLIKRTNQKDIILTHCTLMILRNQYGRIKTTMAIILDEMGVQPRKESINKYKSTIEKLTHIDMSDVKLNTIFECHYNPFEKTDMGKYTNFFTLNTKSIDKLLTLEGKRRTYNHINVYSYISSKVFNISNNEDYERIGMYETCYPSYEEMTDELLINMDTLKKVLVDLKDVNLIHYKNAGKYIHNGTTKMARNTYTTTEKRDYKDQVEQSINFYKERTKMMYDYKWEK